ncbi:NAAT family transporter [Planctomycetota bacterium]|nr:NAAT family transporter [Planctomycetota bacterium]
MSVTDFLSMFVTNYVKYFFLLTPFAGISIFLAMTKDLGVGGRRKMAFKVTGAVVVIATVLFFFGTWIFSLFGITINAFRVGAGVLLFLSGIELVKSSHQAGTVGIEEEGKGKVDEGEWVVPLAIPIIVGPATIGAMLVIGSELQSAHARVAGYGGLLGAIITIGVLLLTASGVERVIGQRGLTIFSKLTGLVFCVLAAQLMLVGIREFYGLGG